MRKKCRRILSASHYTSVRHVYRRVIICRAPFSRFSIDSTVQMNFTHPVALWIKQKNAREGEREGEKNKKRKEDESQCTLLLMIHYLRLSRVIDNSISVIGSYLGCVGGIWFFVHFSFSSSFSSLIYFLSFGIFFPSLFTHLDARIYIPKCIQNIQKPKCGALFIWSNRLLKPNFALFCLIIRSCFFFFR